MKADIILTTMEDGNLIEKKIGTTNVTVKTDCKVLLEKIAFKRFGTRHHVRRDQNVFGFVAVNGEGDTLHMM